MSLSIKQQLCRVVSDLAYKAFGFNIVLKPSHAQLINNPFSNRISFKLPIPQLIYQQYNKDGFLYSDPGVTPKQIADDILVHFKSVNHVEMESDEFGNIRATLKENYFLEKYDKMLAQNKICCLDCDELNFHQNQSIKKVSKLDDQQKVLLILFRKRSQSITLSELRQKYVFEAVQKINCQIFNRTTEIIENYKSNSPFKSPLQTKNYSQLLFGCLRHQIIKGQTILQTMLNASTKIQLNNLTRTFKFGIVIPEQIMLSYPIKDIKHDQSLKLRQIFYDFDLQKPVHLSKIDSVHSQFKHKLNNKLICFPPTIQQLLFTTEQLLSDMKITQIYHLHILLSQFLKNRHSQTPLNTPSSIERNKYINAANIINQNLIKILCLQQIL